MQNGELNEFANSTSPLPFQLSRDEQLEIVRSIALTALPRREQQAVLFTLCGLDPSQVSKFMGIKTDSVYVYLNRAVSRIVNYLSELR